MLARDAAGGGLDRARVLADDEDEPQRGADAPAERGAVGRRLRAVAAAEGDHEAAAPASASGLASAIGRDLAGLPPGPASSARASRSGSPQDGLRLVRPRRRRAVEHARRRGPAGIPAAGRSPSPRARRGPPRASRAAAGPPRAPRPARPRPRADVVAAARGSRTAAPTTMPGRGPGIGSVVSPAAGLTARGAGRPWRASRSRSGCRGGGPPPYRPRRGRPCRAGSGPCRACPWT